MIDLLKSSRAIALAALVLILVLVNVSIFKKEQHLAHGEVVLIELAPVDPRSLMQGDYMALRFKMSNDVRRALYENTVEIDAQHQLSNGGGYLIAQVDAKKVATFKALYSKQTLAKNEVLLQYRVRDNRVKFATNAFFFQEGHAHTYEPARYGQFRVNSKGEVLLAGMFDADLNKLEPVTIKASRQ